VRTTFAPLTADKGLEFDVTGDENVPERLLTDEQRLRQVLRNLLSNAVKFTEHGRVALHVRMAPPGTLPGVDADTPVVAFQVTDTGIGIAEANLESIFGTFQQADGTTSRKYGGTGLGLSISREVAYLLGGEIKASSKLGSGSTFSLYLPVDAEAAEETTKSMVPRQLEAAPAASDDGQRRVLVIEPADGGPLMSLARSVASEVAESQGQIGLSRASTAEQAIEILTGQNHRCVVLEIGPSDQATLDVVTALSENPALRSLPILARVTGTLSATQDRMLRSYARIQPMELLSSMNELRTRMLLHFSADDPRDLLPLMLAQQRADAKSRQEPSTQTSYEQLHGRKVLLVDDDFRNVLAIAGMLEFYGMTVLHAANGRRGIEQLLANDDIDLILMDVMMPEMDGYATTTAIREMPKYVDLPIIAVTAKAMEGDREKSLASGASDYVTKPVDADELLRCMQRWMVQRDQALESSEEESAAT